MLSYLRHTLMSPLWIAELLSGTKSFEANPIIGSRWLNERGLHAARVALAHRMATARRHKVAALVSAADRADFARDGFVVRENLLLSPAFDRLVTEVKGYRGVVREITQGDTINRKIALDRKTLAAIPTLADLLRSPQWRGLIRYIGTRDSEPSVFIQSIFRGACAGPPDPQTLLHADTFHPTVKAWLFLTDVAADAGAFTYVPGSHRLTTERLDWEQRMSLAARHSANRETRAGSFRIRADELGALGLPEPRVFAVKKNTLVVADTFGFHARGPSLGPSARVEIWAYGRRSPFVAWTGLDPWTSAALGQRSAILWKLADLIEAAGLRKNPWRPRTGVSAFEAA